MDVTAQNIFLDVPVESKEALFAFIADKASHLGITADAAELETALAAREKQISTGLQDGFAIPQAKSGCVNYPSMLYVKSKAALPWKTFDESDVQYFMCLLIPAENSSNEHLRLLSNLAVCLMEADFRQKIKTAVEPEGLARLLKEKMEVDVQ